MSTSTETLQSPHRQPRATWREWRTITLISLSAVVVWTLLFSHSRMVAIQNPDAQDYAQIARHLYRGDGFLTSVMPLNGLEWMRQTGRLEQPWWNVHRFPLPSLVEAGIFFVIGPSDFAAALSSGVFFFFTVPLIFLFARRLFSYRVAVLSTFLYAFSGGPMKDAITGLTEPATVFLFLSALYLTLWPRRWWAIPLAGALTGLAFLNRSSVVLYAGPMLWLLWRVRPGRGWVTLSAFILPGVVVVAPWLVRNALLTGDPLFSLTSALMLPYLTPISPYTHDWYQFQYQPAGRFLAAHPVAVMQKWLIQVAGLLWADIKRVGDMEWLFPLFALSVLKRYDHRIETLRNWLLAVFGIHIAVLPLLSNIPRYYVIFAPFIAIFAADMLLGFFDNLGDRLRPPQWGAFAVLGVLPLVNWAHILGPPRQPRNFRVRFETRFENTEWLNAHTPPRALIISDIPWSVGWYADRRSLPIPPTPAEMGRYADYGLRPDGIYLKAPQRIIDTPDGWDIWRRVQFGREAIPGYRLAHIFPDDAVYYERVGP